MAILGLVLMAAAAGVSLDVVLTNTSNVDVTAFGHVYALSIGGLLAAGIVIGLAGVLGVLLLADGAARTQRRRAAAKESRDAAQELSAELNRVAAELEAERSRAQMLDLRYEDADTIDGTNSVDRPRAIRR